MTLFWIGFFAGVSVIVAAGVVAQRVDRRIARAGVELPSADVAAVLRLKDRADRRRREAKR